MTLLNAMETNKRNLYQNEELTKRLEKEYDEYIFRLNESHNYCTCQYPMIICDNRGCRCKQCGGHKKSLPDMDYITYIELRLGVQERKAESLQLELDKIKSWYEEAKDSPTKDSVIPTAVWQLLQKLGDSFGPPL